MKSDSSYIKIVEEYFISHSRKGIMLSSVDYELINEWKTRKVPLQTVLSAIRDAFAKHEKYSFNSVKSLKSISDFIEGEINSNSSNINLSEKSDNIENDNLKSLFTRINNDIKKCRDKRVQGCMLELKNKLILNKHAIETDIIERHKWEQDFLEDIFAKLSDDEKKNIETEVYNFLERYSKQFTEMAYKRSFISHRNNIIKTMFNITFTD